MKQHLVQEQKLQRKMTQNLLQSIQLLQLSGLELMEYIQEIAKENPLIEAVNYDEPIAPYKTRNDHQFSIGEINQATPSMYEQLKKQLYTFSISNDMLIVTEFGIDSLNKEGYLDITLEEWAELCDTTIVKVEEALSFIQSLEPPGIGARNIRECIYLQLKGKVSIPFLKSLLDDHIEWIADENFNAISNFYEIDVEEANAIIELVQSCDPHPGLILENEQPEYILPEATIVKKDGEWQISLFTWNRPSIVIDESYQSLLDVEEEASIYLKEKYRQVDWLNQAIAYRTNTLERIIKKIIVKQHSFFEHGALMLQPLTLREIAEELEISISTVSRTIREKYVQTPYGVTPLKLFFQSGIKQNGNQKASAYAVKYLIGEIIQNEKRDSPLSDEAIKNKLNETFGIQIARRTVRKYRSQLSIPASTKRK